MKSRFGRDSGEKRKEREEKKVWNRNMKGGKVRPEDEDVDGYWGSNPKP